MTLVRVWIHKNMVSRLDLCLSNTISATCNLYMRNPSTCESLLNKFDFFENAMLRVQYTREYPACSCLKHCDRFSHYCARLAEAELEDRQFGHFRDNA